MANLRFEEYGFGEDTKPSIEAAQKRLDEIDKTIEELKENYRKIFPKREIFK